MSKASIKIRLALETKKHKKLTRKKQPASKFWKDVKIYKHADPDASHAYAVAFVRHSKRWSQKRGETFDRIKQRKQAELAEQKGLKGLARRITWYEFWEYCKKEALTKLERREYSDKLADEGIDIDSPGFG